MSEVVISEEAVRELMRDIDGPVGDLMRDIAHQIAVVATATVRVRELGTHRTGRTSNARIPGYTKARIREAVGHAVTHDNYVFGGADAPADPGLFLELPAEQMHEKYPFLTTGLWSVSLD